MTRFLMLAALTLTLGACNDKGDTGDDVVADDDDDDDVESDLFFDISGSAGSLAGEPAAEGLCVHAADPTPALSGNELDILASSTVGAAGAYTVPDVSTNSSIGLLMLVADCAGEGTVMPTATGFSASNYADIADGDVISDVGIYSISAEMAGGFAQLLNAAGYSGDVTTDGALLGFVFGADGVPVEGAVVSSSGSETVYYLAVDTKTGAQSFNTDGTSALTNSLFMIPGAAIGNYSAAADGQTFEPLMVGSQPGFFVVVAFYGS